MDTGLASGILNKSRIFAAAHFLQRQAARGRRAHRVCYGCPEYARNTSPAKMAIFENALDTMFSFG